MLNIVETYLSFLGKILCEVLFHLPAGHFHGLDHSESSDPQAIVKSTQVLAKILFCAVRYPVRYLTEIFKYGMIHHHF